MSIFSKKFGGAWPVWPPLATPMFKGPDVNYVTSQSQEVIRRV